MSVTYTTIDGELLHENRGGVETYYLADPLGSVIECHDANDNTISQTWYWPYGEIQAGTGTNPSPWAFVGTLGYYSKLGPTYVRARYYQPELTRWLTVDPLRLMHGNYIYADHRPVSSADRSGAFTKAECRAACNRLPKKLQSASNEVCKDFKGIECGALARYCKHIGDHESKDREKACWALHGALCQQPIVSPPGDFLWHWVCEPHPSPLPGRCSPISPRWLPPFPSPTGQPGWNPGPAGAAGAVGAFCTWVWQQIQNTFGPCGPVPIPEGG